MEKIAQYKKYVQDVLTSYAEQMPKNENIEVELSFDTAHDHYQIINVGWIHKRRIYGSIIHIDIKNEKIWIQHDGTEIGIANELLDLGVPKHDIVLAFQSPYKRQFTDFAVN